MKKFLLLTVLAVASLAVVQAQTVKQFPVGAPAITITFPANWTEKDKDTNYSEMESPGAEIDFDLWSMKAGDVDDTMPDVISNMKEWLKDLTLTKNPSADFTVNGINFIAMTGTGTPSKPEDASHGVQDVEAYFGSADGGKTLTVLIYFGDKGAGEKFKDDLLFIQHSIKPIAAP